VLTCTPLKGDTLLMPGITDIAHITTKQDMSRWTRAHADVAGIKWSVFPGPGGTMIIVEHAEDRSALNMADVSPEIAVRVAGHFEDHVVRMSA